MMLAHTRLDLAWFALPLMPKEVCLLFLISLPRCGEEGEEGVVPLDSCQQSNIKSAVS